MKTNKKIPLILAVSLLILMGTVGCSVAYKSNVAFSGQDKAYIGKGRVDAVSTTDIKPTTKLSTLP